MLYQIFITQDGSPTLIWTGEDGTSEKMHHSAGALAESFYIYHSALRETLARRWPMRVLSVGLGLGYNELIAIGEAHVSAVTDWQVWSFESAGVLRESFHAWLSGSNLRNSLPEAYDQVLNGVAAKFAIAPAKLKSLARVALADGRLELRGAFPADSSKVSACSCVFYDAFSKKLNPELWREEDLKLHLARLAAPGCTVATYASTGSLNRALKGLGFRLLKKNSFSGKRGNTLAIREGIG